jgi:hypothetical protein
MTKGPQFKFTVQFSAADINKAGKIRRTYRQFTVYAVDSHRAIDKAREMVGKVASLTKLPLPAYRILSVDE